MATTCDPDERLDVELLTRNVLEACREFGYYKKSDVSSSYLRRFNKISTFVVALRGHGNFLFSNMSI